MLVEKPCTLPYARFEKAWDKFLHSVTLQDFGDAHIHGFFFVSHTFLSFLSHCRNKHWRLFATKINAITVRQKEYKRKLRITWIKSKSNLLGKCPEREHLCSFLGWPVCFSQPPLAPFSCFQTNGWTGKPASFIHIVLADVMMSLPILTHQNGNTGAFFSFLFFSTNTDGVTLGLMDLSPIFVFLLRHSRYYATPWLPIIIVSRLAQRCTSSPSPNYTKLSLPRPGKATGEPNTNITSYGCRKFSSCSCGINELKT